MNGLSMLVSYVLVIVDMQNGFQSACSPTLIAAVLDEIRQAMRLGMPIVVLECLPSRFGHTHSEILDLVRGYDSLRQIVLEKDGRGLGAGSGGGKEVEEACQLLGFATDEFRFCGVNTDICVFFTALEVSRKYPESRIALVEKACNTSWGDGLASFAYYAGFHKMGPYSVI